MARVAVVIPIYKEWPSEEEVASYNQCISTLGRYDVCIITKYGQDLKNYPGANRLKIHSFNKHYFSSVEGYSELLTSHFFYKIFRSYDYMLIYQLDAWVFSDELDAWCDKGYDYIGAPWFEHFDSIKEKKQLWLVGNGGLSLRKVSKFMKITNPRQRLRPFRMIFMDPVLTPTRKACYILGIHNTIRYLSNLNKGINEDYYFCVVLRDFKELTLNVPPPSEAVSFSFEKSPEFLYVINGNRLPFGAHAWAKNNMEFWRQFINPQKALLV